MRISLDGIMRLWWLSSSKSEIEARTAVLKVIELLKSRGIKVGKLSISVRNVVALADFGSQIDLIKLWERAGATASKIIYEPEQFPSAAVYRMENSACNLRNIPEWQGYMLRSKENEGDSSSRREA